MKKRNLGLIISAVALLIIGIALLLIFNLVQGVTWEEMFANKWAITIMVAIGLYCVITVSIVMLDWAKR